MLEEIKLSYLQCKRCGHKWIPRKSIVALCPSCHTPYWNLENDDKKNKPEPNSKVS